MQESKDPVVWNVSFEGNDSYSGIVLREVIATEEPNLLRKIFRRLNDYTLNETELRRDRIRIIRYYERRGYDQVQVTVDHTPAGDTWIYLYNRLVGTEHVVAHGDWLRHLEETGEK